MLHIEFSQLLANLINDYLQDFLIDWKKNLFSEGVLVEKSLNSLSNLPMQKKVFSYERALVVDDFLVKSEILSRFISSKFVSLTQAISLKNKPDVIDIKNLNYIEYHYGDWPFKLGEYNFICAYFFLHTYAKNFNLKQEDDLYKILTLIFYTLGENSVFINIFFGVNNLFDLKKFCIEHSIDIQINDQLPINFNDILHMMQKIGYRNSVLITEQIEIEIENFIEFFNFFSEISSNNKDISIKYLNQNYPKNLNNKFVLQFEIMIICADS